MNLESIVNEAKKEYDARHFQQAFPLFKKVAQKGDKEAMYYLGMMYLNGWGTKVAMEQAFQLFSKAAIELQPQAIYMVGRCYEEGLGTTKDLKQAFEYYVAASHQGSHDGMLMQARFYEEGLTFDKDMAKALELYVELAKRDNAYAMYKIGMAYFTGEGIKKSLESAYSWLNKALARGSVDAMNHFRLLGTKSSTDVRSGASILTIGKEYFHSDHPEEGIIYLEIAAKELHVEAMHLLSEAYQRGIGVSQSSQKAFDYLKKAAELLDAEAMYLLGKKYESGDGVASSFTKAALWYERAHAAGHQTALAELQGLRGY